NLLREARERDARTEEEAKAAQYAGDEDPYVKPRELDDDER
ncbi:MAG TPA: ribosome-binding factor A, partial [Microcella sp.]|nr:ribosome-binding factor A [Microcella sp.]